MKREDKEPGNGTNKSPERFLVEEQAKLNVFSVTNVKKKVKLEKIRSRRKEQDTIIVLRVFNVKHGMCLFC